MRKDNSKIQIPNIDKGYTQRTVDTLLASLQEDIILLNAGAGYGKTQALANYVCHFPGKSAWYSISRIDNDLMSFIQNFTKSVQYALDSSGDDFDISIPLLENIDILMEQLVIWLDARIDFMNVIFDDFQEIDNPDIFNLLEILIQTMDKKIRLFIVERRSIPDFFQKYIQSGQAFCIGTEDLKFTPDETELFLTTMCGHSGQWAELICDYTEGWPVGITQIMLQLRQRQRKVTFEYLEEICQIPEISDYFITQVYKMLPFDIQTFLKRTAVLDYMTPPICNRVSGIHNSEGMLRYLTNEKFFVQTLGEDSSLYRYHSIFQRFLLSQTTLEEQREVLRSASHFLLKTNDKIQAAEYACRGKAADIVQTVIEISGDSMLDDRLYGTLERWFTFLDTEHCVLTSKSRFIYGKYLMALGDTEKADGQLRQAAEEFRENGCMQDYKKVLLFSAASKRRAGELLSAGRYLAQVDADPETSWNSIATAVCTEHIKLALCLHQLKDAARMLSEYIRQGVPLLPDTFLDAARQILDPNNPQPACDIRIDHIPEGFLLRNSILAGQMNTAFQSGSYDDASQIARKMIQNSDYETVQTAMAWEMLAVLSWEKGDYRKSVEQARTGSTFLLKNQISSLEFSARHQQLLHKILSIHGTVNDTHHLPAPKEEPTKASPKESRKIHIQCMGCFSVFLDGSGKEVKWRTKKARELFAYLFHLQGAGVSKNILIELLWPDAGSKNAIALFHTTLYSIRQTFVQEGLDDLISYEDKKYALNMELTDSDLGELSAYLKDSHTYTKDPERIMQLYPGSYMGNNGYLWSYGMARKLENEYFKVLRFGASKRTAEHLPESAIPFLDRILESDPYNEEVASQLIACLYQSGRQSDAKWQYDHIRQLYHEDLELDFSKTFKEIIEQ